ncbi:MAG TPA: glycyl-radical enzyme activating protein [Anaerovoracaceae bacterium]|nr:glycyl-radical enzyme activating protein [Anaerovoracaceae bacterium]
MSAQGIIYNIQHYSLHDGPGIRTVVFFKGCPLRCRWCCNPESQNQHPEISYVRAKCIGRKACGFCANACEYGAVSFDETGYAAIDGDRCANCLRCATDCPSRAIRAEGRIVGTDEILDAVEKDSVFYRDSGGGLTVSGGEPLFQGDFLIELLSETKRRKIHTAMETCGFADYSVLNKAAAYLDVILYDIKSMNDEKHKQYTGCGNRIILDNFEKLCRDFPLLPKVARSPVIPGFNDTVRDIEEILAFLEGKPAVSFEALPYHRFGAGKYAALGRQYQVTEKFDASIMRQIEALCQITP